MTCPNPELDTLVTPGCARVLGVLEASGFEAWLVGGCVRDALLGRAANDIDLATNARWEQVRDAMRSAGCSVFETGTAHGTVTVGALGELFEVTTYRTDGTYSDGRHPESVSFVNTVDEDLARRDFTMNAIAYHPTRGLRDPFGGQRDLEARTIRAVGTARERFAEDALRILRAVRFASQLGFAVEAETLLGANAEVERLQLVSAERIAAELDKLLLGEFVHDALLDYPDIIDAVLPEIAPIRNFEHRSPYHVFDVLEHTAYVVAFSPHDLLVRWAALFHDAGKPQSMSVGENGQRHYYGHPALSAPLARQALTRLKKSPRFVSRVEALVSFHDVKTVPEPRPVKRLILKLGGDPELFFALCDLKRADAYAHAPEYQEGAVRAQAMRSCLEELMAAEEPFTVKQLAIGGRDLLERGVAQGPDVGRMLNEAFQAVVDERIPNERGALLGFLGFDEH